MIENLERIIKYKLNEAEAKAFKLSLMWMTYSKKEFPNYQHTILRKDGDPRKSILFKICYKLINQTKGLIDDKEYKYYIIAQLQVLKSIKSGQVHALIDPQCLLGDKAWRRWKMWENVYKRQDHQFKATTEDMKVNAGKTFVVNDLKATKKFLIKQIGSLPNQAQVEKLIESKLYLKWVSLSKISPFYLLLSPFVTNAIAKNPDWKFNLEVYEPAITSEIKEEFFILFQNEFQSIPEN